MSELRMKIAQRDKYSLDQRKKFVDEYLVAENKLYENKKLLAQEQYDLEKKRLKNQAFLNEEEKNKLSELERNVQDAETERIQNLERLDERRRTLLSQDIAEQAQAVERQKEAIKSSLKTSMKKQNMRNSPYKRDIIVVKSWSRYFRNGYKILNLNPTLKN